MNATTSTNRVGWPQRLVWLAPAAALAFAWATSSVRDDLGVANTALLLAAVTVAAASANAVAGVVTAVVAAFALNFFHTEPVHSLRITSGSDLASVLLLAGIGLSVSAVTAARVRRHVHRHSAAAASEAAAELRAMLDHNPTAAEVWFAAVQASSSPLGLVECRLLAERPDGVAVVARPPVVDLAGAEHLVLPEAGAVIGFADPRTQGLLLVKPREGMGSVTIERRLLAAFADQVEAALHAAPPS